MYVCMCVCMYVCMYVFVNARVQKTMQHKLVGCREQKKTAMLGIQNNRRLTKVYPQINIDCVCYVCVYVCINICVNLNLNLNLFSYFTFHIIEKNIRT